MHISPRAQLLISKGLALCVTASLLGMVGYGLSRPDPVRVVLEPKPTVVPPRSAQNFSDAALHEACVRNSAYRSIAPNGQINGVLQSFDVRSLAAEPFSDRGIICMVDGRLVTRLPGGGQTVEEISRVLLVSLNGEAEFTTQDFARQLLKSKAVASMASNEGNDGTVIPSPYAAHIEPRN